MTEGKDNVRHVYIFHHESGVCLYYHAFNPDVKIDPQLIAGFLSAIASVPVKSKKGAATGKAKLGLKELVYNEFRILTETIGS